MVVSEKMEPNFCHHRHHVVGYWTKKIAEVALMCSEGP